MNYRRLSLWLAVCSALFISIQCAYTDDDFFYPDYKQGLAMARQDGRPVFVEITERSCGFCRLLEQQTLSDPAVRRVLEPYEHIQVWWDADPEQKAFAKSLLGRTAFPTLVFLNKNGQPAYTTMGYQKPEPFIADCVKASDLLGVTVPYDARTASEGQTPRGTVVTKPLLPATNKIASSAPHDVARVWTATSIFDEDKDMRAPASNKSGAGIAKVDQLENKVAYDPLKEACVEISSGQLERGIFILNSILQRDARNAEAHYLLAVAYVKTRKNTQAAEQYRLVIRLEPNSKLANLAHQGLQKIGQ